VVVGVAGAQGGAEAVPAGLIDAFGAEEEQLADVIERVALPAAMLEGLLLDPLAGPGDGLVGEVRSGRSALSAFRLVGFSGPSPEPDVRLPPHPALHESVSSGYEAVAVRCLLHGVSIAAPR
jgi:hypothetical protein